MWIDFTKLTKFENDFNLVFLQKSTFIDDVTVKLNKALELQDSSVESEEKKRDKLYNTLGIESYYADILVLINFMKTIDLVIFLSSQITQFKIE